MISGSSKDWGASDLTFGDEIGEIWGNLRNIKIISADFKGFRSALKV